MLTDLEPTLGPTFAPSGLTGRTGHRTRLMHLGARPDAGRLVEQHAHGHLEALTRTHRGGAHKPTRMLGTLLDMATRLTIVAGPHETDPASTYDDTRVLRLGALWTAARTHESPSLLERAISEIDATTVDAIIGWTHSSTAAESRQVDARAKRRITVLTCALETLAPEHGIDLTLSTMRYVTAHRNAA